MKPSPSTPPPPPRPPSSGYITSLPIQVTNKNMGLYLRSLGFPEYSGSHDVFKPHLLGVVNSDLLVRLWRKLGCPGVCGYYRFGVLCWLYDTGHGIMSIVDHPYYITHKSR
jgi:hypothetical protein